MTTSLSVLTLVLLGVCQWTVSALQIPGNPGSVMYVDPFLSPCALRLLISLTLFFFLIKVHNTGQVRSPFTGRQLWALTDLF